MATSSSPMVVIPSSNDVAPDPSPRPFKRLGGFVMTHDTVIRWAARILKKEVSELSQSQRKIATIYPMRRISKYGFTMTMVGAEVNFHYTHDMFVTQKADFVGRNDMFQNYPNPGVPEFEQGELEADAVKILTAYGIHPSEYVFQTVLG